MPGKVYTNEEAADLADDNISQDRREKDIEIDVTNECAVSKIESSRAIG